MRTKLKIYNPGAMPFQEIHANATAALGAWEKMDSDGINAISGEIADLIRLLLQQPTQYLSHYERKHYCALFKRLACVCAKTEGELPEDCKKALMEGLSPPPEQFTLRVYRPQENRP